MRLRLLFVVLMTDRRCMRADTVPVVYMKNETLAQEAEPMREVGVLALPSTFFQPFPCMDDSLAMYAIYISWPQLHCTFSRLRRKRTNEDKPRTRFVRTL